MKAKSINFQNGFSLDSNGFVCVKRKTKLQKTESNIILEKITIHLNVSWVFKILDTLLI